MSPASSNLNSKDQVMLGEARQRKDAVIFSVKIPCI